MDGRTLLFCVFSIITIEVMSLENHRCNVIETYETILPQAVYKDYTETYRCNYFRKCTKTSRKLVYENQRVERTRTVETCCKGYGYLPLSDPTYQICSPLCDTDCGPNGQCSAPQVCSCIFGYEWDNSLKNCNPVCNEGCLNGKCTSPEVCECLSGFKHISYRSCAPICNECTNGKCLAPDNCECDDGYSWDNSTSKCEPICAFGCVNGVCETPGVCKCLKGFEINHEQKCEPVCTNCLNGNCIAPGKCFCNDGYSWTNSENQCSPVCMSGCLHGICKAPNNCECFNGYRKEDNEKCTPICSNCLNGDCVSPQNCSCHNGYIWDASVLQCNPVCTMDCGGGHCVAPDKCQCFHGYTMDARKRCVPICEKCANGVCLAPNSCQCFAGYMWNNTTNDCSPVCQSGCLNGICKASETCECFPGYFPTSLKNVCEPNCNPACELSKCISINTCECLQGYHFVQGSKSVCEPHCMVPCSSNNCSKSPLICDEEISTTSTEIISETDFIDYSSSSTESMLASDTIQDIDCQKTLCSPKICSMEQPSIDCVCSSEYRIVNDTHCAPVCSKNTNYCICIAPNICTCFVGYRPSDSDPFSCVLDDDPNQLHLEKIAEKQNIPKWFYVWLVGLAVVCSGVGMTVYWIYHRRKIVYSTTGQSYINDSADSDFELCH